MDAHDIARVIGSVAGNDSVHARLKAECRPRAAELSWSQSAAAMFDLLEAQAGRS